MDRLSIEKCQEVLLTVQGEGASEEQILAMRDMLYEVAGIVIDAYSELGKIDQSQFFPTGATFSYAETRLVNELNQSVEEFLESH